MIYTIRIYDICGLHTSLLAGVYHFWRTLHTNTRSLYILSLSVRIRIWAHKHTRIVYSLCVLVEHVYMLCTHVCKMCAYMLCTFYVPFTPYTVSSIYFVCAPSCLSMCAYIFWCTYTRSLSIFSLYVRIDILVRIHTLALNLFLLTCSSVFWYIYNTLQDVSWHD